MQALAKLQGIEASGSDATFRRIAALAQKPTDVAGVMAVIRMNELFRERATANPTKAILHVEHGHEGVFANTCAISPGIRCYAMLVGVLRGVLSNPRIVALFHIGAGAILFHLLKDSVLVGMVPFVGGLLQPLAIGFVVFLLLFGMAFFEAAAPFTGLRTVFFCGLGSLGHPGSFHGYTPSYTIKER